MRVQFSMRGKRFHRVLSQGLICLALLGIVRFPIAAQTGDYDIVIRNGRVLDGGGNPWILADVAIKDGRFVRIGKVEGKGKREIDARGRYVSPGWIDVMDQSGSVLRQNGLAENKLMMGVTSAIGGEGGTPVPAEKIPEYFAGLEKSGISINFGTYFSETQARVAVIGQESRAPTPEELARMKAIMETAMKAGVIGMTTALIYPPSSYAKTEELIEMAKVAGQYGGIYASHIRGEGKELVQSVEEAIMIGEKGGLPVEVFHLKAAHQPGWGTLMRAAGEKIEQQIAKELNKEPADAAFDLVMQGKGRVYAIYHMMSEQDIVTALKFLWTSIGSDAGAALKPGTVDGLGLAHPRSYGNHPRLIARYVREQGVLTLPEAIRKMTSWPATRMRIASRGLIKEGLWADVVIFDYDKIQDRATYDQPLLSPVGIDYVLVNGQVVIEQGKHTGARPGKVIYGPGQRP